jgi:hypothetical protein
VKPTSEKVGFSFFALQNVQIAPSTFASTRNKKALRAFRETVLEEARLSLLDWEADEVIRLQDEVDLDRLQKLLDLVIPEEMEGNNEGID